VRNPEAGVPFAFLFAPADQLDLVNALTSDVALFKVGASGTITPAGNRAPDGQVAACWIASARDFGYVANTGSGSISQYRIQNGRVTLLNPVAASVPGAIDLTAGESGRFLYAESGATGSVDVFAINADGSLTLLQDQPVPDGSSLEGIALR
jgi:6-phosphogluconolactonase (cycloisomerase 2 family)